MGKYHMVRFFERRKAERAVKKAERALSLWSATTTTTTTTTVDEGQQKEEKGQLERKVHEAEVDLKYTILLSAK